MEDTTRDLAARVSVWLDNIEKRPRMYGQHAYVIEGNVREWVALRARLRGHDGLILSDAMSEFLTILSGSDHPCGLAGLLRDHGMLGRGYRDGFGELPRLLGDFARWADARWADARWPAPTGSGS